MKHNFLMRGGNFVVPVTHKLAMKLGLERAIFLQTVASLLDSGNGKLIGNERWVFNTVEEWRESFFPFWSNSTIRRIIQELEEAGFLVSCQPDGVMSRKKYYRIGEGACAKITDEDMPDLLESKNAFAQIEHIRNCSNWTNPLTKDSTKNSEYLLPGVENPAEAEIPKPKKPRAPDPMFDAIASAFNLVTSEGKVAKPNVTLIAKTKRDLIDAYGKEVTPDEIKRRVARLKDSFDKPSPTALVKHWLAMGELAISKTRTQPRIAY